MAETEGGGQRRKLTEALTSGLKNGPGTVISRLIIMAMPFMAGASIWVGEKAVDLLADKVESTFARIEKRLDKIDASMDASDQFGRRLELQVQRNSDDIEYLRDVSTGPRKSSRDR